MSALPVSLCALALAFCGLIYEFTIAQSLSILIGNSVLQYALTIGLFLVSMGVGAMPIPGAGRERSELAQVQLILCVLAPMGLLGLWTFGINGSKYILFTLACGLIIAVGWLTGRELPLLLQLAGPKHRLKVLGFDHFGMLLACILFPLLLLPQAGVFVSVFVAAALNALMSARLATSTRARIFASAAAGLLMVAIALEPALRAWLSQRFLA